MSVALITGICGQDGAYLSRLLLEEGYEVHGLERRSAQPNKWRLEAVGALADVHLHEGDMTDYGSLRKVLDRVAPSQVYNLAAQSNVGHSFKAPDYTQRANAEGVRSLLELLHGTGARLYQASTSEMFGSSPPPQSEVTPFKPVSPYGSAKLSAHLSCRRYREKYGSFVSCGILFNHESALRGEDFVTQKIAKGIRGKLRLGNLDAKRDWGHAADFVRAMYLMLTRDVPDDYVISTGESRTVREFLEAAGRAAGVEPKYEIAPEFFRPAEVDYLCGDSSKARRELGWEPQITFQELVESMVAGEVYPSGYKIAA